MHIRKGPTLTTTRIWRRSHTQRAPSRRRSSPWTERPAGDPWAEFLHAPDPWYRNPAPGREYPGNYAAGALPGRSVDAEHSRGKSAPRSPRASLLRLSEQQMVWAIWASRRRQRRPATVKPTRTMSSHFCSGQRGALARLGRRSCSQRRTTTTGEAAIEGPKGFAGIFCQRAQFSRVATQRASGIQLRDPLQYLQALSVAASSSIRVSTVALDLVRRTGHRA